MSTSSTTLFAEAHKGDLSGLNSYYVTLKSLNGFTGVLSVQIEAPPVLHACCNSSNISLANNASFGWGVIPSSVGNDTVRITARSGSTSHSILLTMMVEDIAISFNPSTVIIPVFTGGNTTMTLSSLNGPMGNITLRGDYNDHVGITSFAQSSVILPRNGRVSTTMYVGGGPYAGTYSLPFELIGGSLPDWIEGYYGYHGYINVTLT